MDFKVGKSFGEPQAATWWTKPKNTPRTASRDSLALSPNSRKCKKYSTTAALKAQSASNTTPSAEESRMVKKLKRVEIA
jgi:hypothetical protein